MEDFAADLLRGKLWFGKYPTPEEVDIVSSSGFTHIVNLCTPEEITWEPYVPPKYITTINYPFCDGTLQKPLGEKEDLPEQWKTFPDFIERLIEILKQPQTKIYVHCLGGHGRSPTIAAIVYGLILNKDSDTTIGDVREAHQRRKVMKDKWRRLGAPQRAKQKRIIKWFLDH